MYAIKDVKDVEFDYLHILSSLCTLIRDSDTIVEKLIETMELRSFNTLADTSTSGTHPEELFLKIVSNLNEKQNLNYMDASRPYRCDLWNDSKKRSCITDFVCYAVFDEAVVTDDFKTFTITLYVPSSQIRYKSTLIDL